MKNMTIGIFYLIIILALVFAGNASAGYIGNVIGDNKTNDDKVSVYDLMTEKGVIQDFNELTYLGKIEDGAMSIDAGDWGQFEISTWGQSGDWESTWAGVDYVTVKGGTSFAVYSIDHLGKGGWTTEYLLNKGEQRPDLSHITFWSASATVTRPGPGGGAQVPEPATIFLLGSGLLGLFGYRKKFWKPKK